MLGLFFGIRAIRRAYSYKAKKNEETEEENKTEEVSNRHKTCRFCHNKGHTIVTCKDPRIKEFIENNQRYMDNYINNANTTNTIREYVIDRLESYSDIELAILANEYYIVTSLPRSIHIDALTNIFIKQQ